MKSILYALAFITMTASAQELVKDINSTPASQASYPGAWCVPCGGKSFFVATDNEHGRELWTTDGTEAGTHLVKDVVEGLDAGAYDKFQCYKEKLYFGSRSLWSTDGTEAGTKEVFPDYFGAFTLVSDKLLVTTDTSVYSMDPDGTDKVLLKKFIPLENGNISYYLFGATTTWSYFTASFFDQAGLQKTQLWGFDGETLTMLHEAEKPNSSMFTGDVLDDKLFFELYDQANFSYSVWVSDGTAENTYKVKDNVDLFSTTNLRIPGKMILRQPGNNFGTWLTDGTEEGTIQIFDDFSANGGAKVGDHYYFMGVNIDSYEYQIIRTDENFQNRVFLTTTPSNDNLLLSTLGDKLLFASSSADKGIELFSDDAETTTWVKDINPGAQGSKPRRSGVVNDLAIFVADDGEHGFEYWKSNGTAAGTTFLKDIALGTNSSEASSVYFYNNQMYFAAKASEYEAGLWKSDGTEEGTVILDDTKNYAGMYGGIGKYVIATASGGVAKTDIETGITTAMNTSVDFGSTGGPIYRKGKQAGNILYVNTYFRDKQNQDLYGAELYRANPVTNEFEMVKDINPGQNSSAVGDDVIGAALNSKLIFSANSPDGIEPWVTDGTAEGTIQLKNINDTDSSPLGFTAMGNNIFFVARGTGSEIRRQLWMTDGTPAGTKYVKEPGEKGGVTSDDLAVLGNKIVYTWTNGESGFSELWITDGTATGSQKVKDLPGIFTTWAYASIGDKVLFFADNETLWVTDGTAEGTRTIAFSHGAEIDPKSIVVKNGFMYFYENKKIFRTNGTEQEAELIGDADLRVGSEFYVNDKYVLLFKDDATIGRELYRYTIIERITGIEEEEPESIVVYPNPTAHTLFVKAKVHQILE